MQNQCKENIVATIQLSKLSLADDSESGPPLQSLSQEEDNKKNFKRFINKKEI